jgi:hypothetical protein
MKRSRLIPWQIFDDGKLKVLRREETRVGEPKWEINELRK